MKTYKVDYGNNNSSQSFTRWADACAFMRYLLREGTKNIGVSEVNSK